MPATEGRWPLVGRDEELALLDAEARRGPVVVAGPAGVGKSRLVADWSRDLDGATTTVTATRSSGTVPFGALAPWVPADLSAEAAPSATLRTIAGHLAATARTVVVDDAHLLDDGSAAVVVDLARHHDVRLVVTVRSGEPCPDPVTALWAGGIGTRLDLRPLAEPECTRLLERRLGGRADAVARRRVWTLSAGNPMHLREATEAALDQGRLVEADGEWTWTGPLTGTPRLVDLVEARLGRTSDEERQVLEVVALGEPVPLDVVLEVVAAEPVAALEAAGLLSVVERAGTDVVGLGHPLYGEVLRATTGRLRARQHVHALAVAGLAHGLERRDPLRIALWLGEGGAGPGGAGLLLGASARAMVLQDYDLSLRLADGAVDAGGGAPAHVARARALRMMGRADEGTAALDRASAVVEGPTDAVQVAQLRALASFWELRSSEGAVAEVRDAARLPTAEAAQVTATGACVAVLALDLDRARVWADAARGGVEPGGPAWALAVACDALAATWQGDPDVLLAVEPELTRAAARALAVDVVPSALGGLAFEHAMVLAGRCDEAADRMAQLVERDPTEASVYVALPALLVARTALAQGRVATAAARARQALDLMGHGRYVFGRAVVAAATLATAAAQGGDPAAAEEALARAAGHDDRWVPDARAQLDLARAWAVAARGQVSEAVDRATAVAARLATIGAHGLEVPALLDVVRLGGGAAVADRLEERRHDHPFAAAAADLARALADGDGVALDAASSRWEALGGRLVAAEAAAQAAGAHARAGLRQRQAAARHRAHELLGGCEGARPPLLAGLDRADVVEALTAREREVVLMAAAGATNREIATELGRSLRTVNSHLNHAYTKLGTSDRHELARLLGPAAPPRPR